MLGPQYKKIQEVVFPLFKGRKSESKCTRIVGTAKGEIAAGRELSVSGSGSPAQTAFFGVQPL